MHCVIFKEPLFLMGKQIEYFLSIDKSTYHYALLQQIRKIKKAHKQITCSVRVPFLILKISQKTF